MGTRICLATLPEIPFQDENSFWLPAGTWHAFRNVGDSELTAVGFLCDSR